MPRTKRHLFDNLTMRMLALTLVFVFVVEVLIYIPSITQFRKSYLEARLAAAETTALALEEVPGNMVSIELEEELLASIQLQAVVIGREDSRQLLLRTQLPISLSGQYDLSDPDYLTLASDALIVLFRKGTGIIQVTGASSNPRFRFVEIMIFERHLYDAMIEYTGEILGITLAISLFTALMIFSLVQLLVIRPVIRIASSITGFRERPQDTRATMAPSGRRDEIGLVERELCLMQEELRQSLNQKSKLADLGEAVSKINHDLKNILATAQLSSDRLRTIEDPTVKSLTPRLLGSIDRAISLCERTLKHGRAEEPAPRPIGVRLAALIDEIGLSLGVSGDTTPIWNNQVAGDFTVQADPDHLFRAIMNLGRNAINVLDGKADGKVTLMAEATPEGTDIIHMIDNGPGVPEAVRENLFKPFVSGRSADGSGLGLAISRELIRAHGGEIILDKSDASGTTFCLCLPHDADSQNTKTAPNTAKAS